MKPLREFKDNDIEVLGLGLPTSADEHTNDKNSVVTTASEHNPTRRRPWIWIIATAAVVALLIMMFILGRESTKSATVEAYAEPVETEITACAVPEPARLTELTSTADSINGVRLMLTPVDKTTAAVTFEFPGIEQKHVLLATPAADFRADNGDIVGEFYYDGKKYTSGIRKRGWCYINPDGVISIGYGAAEDVIEQAKSDGGCFFRQYALVMDGELCPNELKGKAARRAIGFIDKNPVIVCTMDRESVYDFSQALADYGFSHALMLPGGGADWLLRGKDETQYDYHQPPDDAKMTFLTFSTK